MKKVLKVLKMLVFSVLGVLLLLFVVGFIFIKTSPEFGGKATQEDLELYAKSENYKDDLFQNQIETNMDMGFVKGVGIMWDFIKGIPNSRPEKDLPMNSIDSTFLEQSIEQDKIMWFGHSAFLLQIEGRNILLDPMFGQVPAPHPYLGQNRFNAKLPIEVEKLPQIDIIILSHDHYDHLDYGSIMKLKDKTKYFFVPLGVGRHLREWGIRSSQIKEMDWWYEQQLDGFKVAFTPSRHFSGRGLGDRFTTLWGSWVIQSQNKSIFFSGDGGYGPHFKEIGEKYGPFDFAMLECGQYNEQWSDIHMMPEQSAQAGVDLKAKVAMPIHWGAFTLALHTWTDPVKRFIKKSDELSLPNITPQIGEVVNLDSTLKAHTEKWWETAK